MPTSVLIAEASEHIKEKIFSFASVDEINLKAALMKISRQEEFATIKQEI